MKQGSQYQQMLEQSNLYRNNLNTQLFQNNQEDPYEYFDGLSKRSLAWRYFDYDKKSNVACCKLCYAVYLVRKSVTTPMMKHLREQHASQFSKRSRRFFRGYDRPPIREYPLSRQMLDVPNLLHQSQIPKHEEDVDQKVTKKLTIKQFFLFDQQNDKAICNLCSKPVNYDNTNSCLQNHIKQFHENIDLGIKPENIGQDFKKQKPYKSYFDESEEQKAQSKIKQEKQYKCSEDDDYYVQNKVQTSKIWNYFIYFQKQQKSMCKICKQWMDTPNKSSIVVIRHIRTFHSQLNLQQLLHNYSVQQISTFSLNKQKIQSNQNLVDQFKHLPQNFKKQMNQNKPFMIDYNRSLAICEWCQSFYNISGKGLSKFMYHIEVMHPNIKMQDYFHNGSLNEKEIFQEKLQKVLAIQEPIIIEQPQIKPSESVQIKDKELHQNININRLDKQLNSVNFLKNMNYVSKYLANLFTDSRDSISSSLLAINRDFGINIAQLDTGQLKNIVFVTKKQASEHTQQILNFWEKPTPLENSNLKSIIYLTSHNRNIRINIHAFCLVFHENIQSYLQIFQKLFPCYKKGAKYTLCCPAQSIMRKAIKIYTRSQQNCSLYIYPQILTSSNTHELRNIRSSLLGSQKSEQRPFFIGMTLSQILITQLTKITSKHFDIKSNISDFFTSLCSFLKYSLSSAYIPRQGFQQIYISKKAQANSELKNLKQFINGHIFNKLCISYVYSKFMKLTQKGNNLLMVEYKKSEQDTQYNQSVLLKYNALTEQIDCDCNLNKWTGLPCPHMIKVANNYKILIRQYINSFWLKLSISKQQFKQCSNQQDEIFFDENDNKLPKSQQKFYELFWK